MHAFITLSALCVLLTNVQALPHFRRQESVPGGVALSPELQSYKNSLQGQFVVLFKSGLDGQEVSTDSHFNWLSELAKNNSFTWKDATTFNPEETTSSNPCAGSDTCLISKFTAISGYTAKIPSDLVPKIQSRSEIDIIEQEALFTATGDVSVPVTDDQIYSLQKLAGTSGKTYTFPKEAGSGVDVYVLDTGVNVNHPEFEGRASNGFDATGEGITDTHGHGTHVSGSIASKTFGVAKKANIINVKVLKTNGGGSSSFVIAGIEFVIKEAGRKGKNLKSVINMSLGSDTVQSVNLAVQKAIDAGVAVVVAAGNQDQDACSKTPASAKNALSVGASDKGDTIASFSNFGSCVDVFAPGVGIISTSFKLGSEFKSGTSMSCPHVAGVVALAISANPNKFTSVDEIFSFVKSRAKSNIVKGNLKGSPNLFVTSRVGSNVDVKPPPPPPSKPSPVQSAATTTTTTITVPSPTDNVVFLPQVAMTAFSDVLSGESEELEVSKDCQNVKINTLSIQYHIPKGGACIDAFDSIDCTGNKLTNCVKCAEPQGCIHTIVIDDR
ncbi:subtilisin-like serine protease, partial [Nowakowskiella sp. JEL0407]